MKVFLVSKRFLWVAVVILAGACIATAVVFGEVVHVGNTRVADRGTAAGSHMPTDKPTGDLKVHPVPGTDANVYTAGPFRVEALTQMASETDADGNTYSLPQVKVTNTGSSNATAQVQVSFSQHGAVVAQNSSETSALLGPGQSQTLTVEPVDSGGNLLSGAYIVWQLTDLWVGSGGTADEAQHYILLSN